ncbi:ATP-binding protein [Halalkalibaculum sp. DA3122]|uniref:sensor histidine kinase n=1 Tax=Halalkalibaculum sp. DA3122 TaxID=3373607 RepID=UPI0037551991
MEKQKRVYSLRTLLAVAGGLLCLLLLLEGWLYHIKPYPPTENISYKSSLTEAVDRYNERHNQLLDRSQSLAEQLEAQLQAGANRQALYQLVKQYSSFWGTTLFNDAGVPQVWSGFSLSSYPGEFIPASAGDGPFVDVIKQNNVISFLCRIPFAVEDSSGAVEYELLTTQRIRQTNALPIGESHEFDLLAEQELSLQYPAELSFFETFPDSALGFRVLSTQSRDSVGVAYIPPGIYGQTDQQWQEKAWFWRSLLGVIAYIAIMILLYRRLSPRRSWSAAALRLLIIVGSWLLFRALHIPEQWFLNISENGGSSQLNIILLARESIFLFLTAEAVVRSLYHKIESFDDSNFIRTMFSAAVFGLAGVGFITGIIYESYRLLIQIDISLFDLQIFPSLETFVVYISLALLFYAVIYALAGLGYVLLKVESGPYKLVLIIAFFSFFIGLMFLQLYLPDAISLNWATWLSLAIFTGVLVISAFRARFSYFPASFSVIRATTLGTFLVTLACYPVLQNAQFVRMDNDLLERVRSYHGKEDTTARQATRQMLVTLENHFRGTTPSDLGERIPFLQSRFTQTIEQALTPRLRSYSFNVQLIRPSGELIADYSTDLNAPNWTTVFDMSDLSAVTEIERISKSNNRPIVQLPELENSDRYETFYRGWIPIFSPDSDEQIAWILCSVYREHPDFNKPIRAVLASLTYTNWDDSYVVLEYQEGALVHTAKHGLAGHFPRFHTLRDAELNALSSDSVLFYSSSEFQQTYRNVLVQTGRDSVLKGNSVYPNTNNKLFAFFRFSFSVLLVGLIFIPLYLLVTAGRAALRHSNQRFEYRIFDSFLIATLLFLGLLIATTHYAIHTQNKEIVRQDLFEKLDKLATAAQTNIDSIDRIGLSTSFSMQPLVAPLNVDAAYYKDKLLAESTTPQIYQQNLLPSVLPFDVYNDLYLRQKSQVTGTVQLASQNLLIGYQSLLSEEGDPVGAVAIPTFLESPKYDQQLLETTSYLVVFYLFTFGIFILATTMIAKRVTQPLRSIQEGLNKISEGKLDTKIPVKSEDEIGLLAGAYNEMVERLKEVRNELAIAEREAAWKEMAQQVAHEIKNPLTPMKLNIQHLERQLANGTQDLDQLTSSIKKITGNLTEQIQTLNNIASDFSKFSKPIDQEFSRIDVNSILHSVADLYQQDEKTQIEMQLTGYSIHVSGVADELRRVFINLVKNAFEAMPDGGGRITIKSYIRQGSAFIEIEDNGNGISEEDKSKIFVPNFSTKSSGTGLGLAISKKIIEAHDGSITFASIEGRGTTFVIKLPLWKK